MDKDMVLDEFRTMIKNSWTYAKMNEREKQVWENILISNQTLSCLKGNSKHRWAILQAIYNSYLRGLGYTDFNWREGVNDYEL